MNQGLENHDVGQSMQVSSHSNLGLFLFAVWANKVIFICFYGQIFHATTYILKQTNKQAYKWLDCRF